MRKKRATLWLLLCGVCVIGGAAYLNKAEPLKAAEKSETAQTKKTAPTAKTKAVAKTAAVTQTSEEMVEVGPPDEDYSTLPNFNFQQLSGDVDPSKTNRASMPEGYGFVGSRKTSAGGGAEWYGLNEPFLPRDSKDTDIGYGSFTKFEANQPLNQQYYATYYYTYSGASSHTQFMWQRLPSPSNPGIADGLAFAYYPSGNGNRGGLATTERVVKYNPDEAFGYAYGEYELGSPNFFTLKWFDSGRASVPTDSSMEIKLRDQLTGTIGGDVNIGTIDNLAANPVGSFFLGFNKSAFEGKDSKYFTVYLDKVYQTPVFFRNMMVLMTSVHANPTSIKVPLGKDVVPYFTAEALKQTMGDVYYYPDAANNTYDYNDPQGGSLVDPNTITDLKILSDNVPTSDLISKKKLMIQFKYQTPDTQKTKVGIVPIDFEITAGNSILLGGKETDGTIYKNNPNLSSLALTLNNVGTEAAPQYQIAATKGNNPNGDAAFNTNANATQPYYQVDYFAPPADGQTLNLNQDLTTKGAENGSSLVAVKDSTPNALISSWGTDGKLDVEFGGVLRVYMSDPTKEWLYQNNELNAQFKPNDLPQKNYVFYQVTENGLEPMYTNQMTLNTPATADRISTGIKTPASILSKLFNESTVANSKYLTPHEGTTLADYTFVWDFQDGAGTVSGQKNILANLVTQKNNSPYVFTVPVKPVVNVTNMEFVPWLQTLGSNKWQSSIDPNNFIPADQTFSVAWMPNTEVDKTGKAGPEGMIDTEPGKGTGNWGSAMQTDAKNLLRYNPSADVPKLIRFNNVGFYQGQSVDLEVSWTNVNPGTSTYADYVNKNFIGTKEDFLSFGFAVDSDDPDVAQMKDLTFTFYKHGDYKVDGASPLPVSGYWQYVLAGGGERSSIVIAKDQIDQIFSPPAPTSDQTMPDHPTVVKDQYKLDKDINDVLYNQVGDESLQFFADVGGLYSEEQRGFTLTYKNKSSYSITPTAHDTTYMAFKVSQKTNARVAFPAPQGIDRQYDTVTTVNDPTGNDPLIEQFVQYIPYQDSQYYLKELTWTLPTGGLIDDPLSPVQPVLNGTKWDWEIIDAATGKVVPNTILSSDGNGNISTTDAALSGNNTGDFYSHYFTFRRKLKINDSPDYVGVQLGDLNPINGKGQYYQIDGDDQKVTLTGKNSQDENIDYKSEAYKTAINFEADLEYQYNKLSGSTLTPFTPEGEQPVTAKGLLTHTYADSNPVPPETVMEGTQKYGLNAAKSQPAVTTKIKYTTPNSIKLAYEEFVPWLPFYDKWKNSETDVIPKENAFVMKRSDDTEIIETETSPEIWSNYKNNVYGKPNNVANSNTVAFPTDKGEQHITFSNVGYYEGHRVSVKVSITPEKASGRDSSHYSFIGIKGQDANNNDLFLDVSLDVNSKSADVVFEFLDEAGHPLPISGYWTLSNINSVKELSLPLSEITNIYSTSREYKQGTTDYPNLIQYEEFTDASWGDALALKYGLGIGDPTGQIANQISATITYNNQTEFKYRMTFLTNSSYGFDIKYVQGSDAKVAIPDPMGMAQTFDEITADQYPASDDTIKTPVNNQFIQFIPFENTKNQTQEMEWTMPAIDPALKYHSWTITNENGENANALFTITEKGITAKIEQSDLYNHYYTFQQNVEIALSSEIDPTVLVDNYLTNNGNVSLKVDDLADVTSPFSTEVNFAANLPYTYELLDKDGSDVPLGEFKPTPTEGNALITQGYKDDGFSSVDDVINKDGSGYGLIGYKIDGVQYSLNDDDLDTQKIKYTSNPVTLVYREGAGNSLSFEVTSTLNFGSRTIQAQNDIPQESEWKLLAENALGYKVTAERTYFRADGVTNPLAAKLSLHFEDNDGESKSVEIPPATGPVDLNKIPLVGSWTIDSNNSTATSKEAGFSLNVPAGNITAGKQYKSEITFTLTDAP